MNLRRILLACSFLLILGGTILLGEQVWLGAKAQVAKALIAQSFEKHLDDGKTHPPWSWADMHPIARITVPRIDIERTALSGASGNSMAFGPGHIDGTAMPGEDGNCVLAGHRDTWFAFLAELVPGDEVLLQVRAGTVKYSVEECRIISMTDTAILGPGSGKRLTLITCYPFSGLLSTPWRYAVICRPC
ncbi:class GN sortase [Acidobacteriota bacterium]